MKTTHVYQHILYTLSNEDLKVGDETFPVSAGISKDDVYIHERFEFARYMSGFPNDPHIIEDLHHNDQYKPYEIRTNHGYGPKEKYFKIISKKDLMNDLSPSLQAYYKNKYNKENDYPLIYVVKSSQDGVLPPDKRQVIQIEKNVGKSKHDGESKWTPTHKYILDEYYPYEVEIREDKISFLKELYGSGCGDLWDSSYYFTFKEKDAYDYYVRESIRVKTTYSSYKKMNDEINISLNQINTISGDIEGNFNKIKERIDIALKNNSDIIVFPETAFTGYCVGALWDNIDFILDQEACLNKVVEMVPSNIAVIIGYVSYHGMKLDGFPHLKNSVAVINQNKIQRYDKQLLANGDHHEDRKYFKPGNESKIFDLVLSGKNIKVGVPICEDSWYIDHARDIPNEMVKMGAELLISINQSYFYYGKQIIREKLFHEISSKLSVPVVEVNSIGVGDIVKNIIIYDGSSMAYNANGVKTHQGKRFEEDTINITYRSTVFSRINGTPIQIEKNKYDEIIDAICFEQKELFSLLGIKNAQVHISGGIDSAIVMALSILSMGKENCVFITNPTSLNSDSLPMVYKLNKNFGTSIFTNELEEIYQVLNRKDTENFGSELNKTGQATMQAVLRTVQGLAACHRFKSGIVACGNHTEIVLGWASFHDIGSIGVHSPIGDLTKLELYELCIHINKRFFNMGFTEFVIPEELYNGKIIPAAELPDSKYDPIDYYIQSGLCAEVIRHRKTKRQLLDDWHNKKLTEDFFPSDIYEKYNEEQFINEVNFTFTKSRISVFKAAQSAPIPVLSPRSRGFSNRETIINKYKS